MLVHRITKNVLVYIRLCNRNDTCDMYALYMISINFNIIWWIDPMLDKSYLSLNNVNLSEFADPWATQFLDVFERLLRSEPSCVQGRNENLGDGVFMGQAIFLSSYYILFSYWFFKIFNSKETLKKSTFVIYSNVWDWFGNWSSRQWDDRDHH